MSFILLLRVALKVLQQVLAGMIRDDLDRFLGTDALAVEAVLAVLNILEDRLLRLGIPADDVYEASLVAQLATDALLGIELDFVISENHI